MAKDHLSRPRIYARDVLIEVIYSMSEGLTLVINLINF